MTIDYPLGTVSNLGQPIRVCDGIYRLSIPLPACLSLEHINAWILEDGDGWTLVDCGFDWEKARQVWLQARECLLGDRPVKRIILTHHHIDHAGLSHWLEQQFQAPLWVAEEELRYIREFHQREGLWSEEDRALYYQQLDLSTSEIEAMLGFLSDTGAGMGPLPEKPHLIREAHQFEINGHRWQVMNIRGHSPNQCTLYCEALMVWIAADQMLPQLTTYAGMEPGDPMAIDTVDQLLESLQQLEQLPEDTLVLPAHGAPFVGIASRVHSVKRSYRRLFDQVLACCDCDKALSAMEVRRKLIPDNLFYASPFFLIAKVAGALRHLGRKGLLETSLEPDGRVLYRRA